MRKIAIILICLAAALGISVSGAIEEHTDITDVQKFTDISITHYDSDSLDFILNFFGREDRIVKGNKKGDYDAYMRGLLRGTHYEGRCVSATNIRDDALNGDSEAWNIIEKIAFDNGMKAIRASGCNVLAFDSYSGIVYFVYEDSPDKIYFTKQSSFYTVDELGVYVLEHFIRKLSGGTCSLLTLENDTMMKRALRVQYDKKKKSLVIDNGFELEK